MKKQMKLIIKSFKLVFKKPGYISLAVIISLSFFYLSLWLANYGMLSSIITSDFFDFKLKMQTLFNPLILIRVGLTLKSVISTTIISILLGINFAFFVFFLKKQIAVRSIAGVGIFGIISGLLGIGCAACGSVVLAAVFGAAGTSAVISILPFNGFEFAIFGILALLFSIYLIAKKIQDPLICK